MMLVLISEVVAFWGRPTLSDEEAAGLDCKTADSTGPRKNLVMPVDCLLSSKP